MLLALDKGLRLDHRSVADVNGHCFFDAIQ
jgi:hypothetical protein